VGVQCAQDKWDKAQRLLHELQEEISKHGCLNHKALEQKRGFFVHLQ
jgi:hypothetical protein